MDNHRLQPVQLIGKMRAYLNNASGLGKATD